MKIKKIAYYSVPRSESSTCSCCGNEISKRDDNYQVIDNNIYCNDCFNEKFFICDKCNEIFPIDEMNSHNDGYYCNTCFTEKLGENNE